MSADQAPAQAAAPPYETAVEDEGAGPAIVLVHGTPLDRRAWDGLAPSLARGHRVLRYDLRGHGSARDVALPASFATLADDLRALLDARGIGSAHVVGHSFGGQVAQTFAAAYPERLSALTVVCSRATPFPPFAATAEVIDRDGVAAVTEPALERWFTPEAVAADVPAVRYARACMRRVTPGTLAAAFRLIAAFDLGDRLAALPVRARYVAAEHDTVGTPEEMRAAAERTPHGEFRLEAGLRHMFPVRFPERLAQLDW